MKYRICKRDVTLGNSSLQRWMVLTPGQTWHLGRDGGRTFAGAIRMLELLERKYAADGCNSGTNQIRRTA